MFKRTIVVLGSLAAMLPAAGPAGATGPWNADPIVQAEVDCDGDGTPETLVAVNPAPAAERSAVFLRPAAVAHVEGSTSRQISKAAHAELWVNGSFVMVLDEGFSWGSGSGALETCRFVADAFVDADGNLVQIVVVITYFATPRG